MSGGDTRRDEMPEIRQHTTIPIRVAQRLPMYHRQLYELLLDGVTHISSAKLSAYMGVTASQLRQDLSHFGRFGHHSYGYRVDELFHILTTILGLTRKHKLVLVGAGPLGQALAAHEGFVKRGFCIEAIFDIDPILVGRTLAGAEIMPAEELPGFLQRSKIDIGIIAVPADAAQEVAETLVSNGVRALWNFAPRRLEVPPTVVLEHVHLSDSLMSLAYRLHKLGVCKQQTAYRC
ncbi:MAG: redox-sensing transcriptional repressor Rex [Limnochordia bacterium]|jgi:redox-sensing transcriptional repressor